MLLCKSPQKLTAFPILACAGIIGCLSMLGVRGAEAEAQTQLPSGMVCMLPLNAATINTLAFSPDGKHLAMGDISPVISIYNASTGVKEGEFKGHEGGVKGLAYSPDGQTLASSGPDMMILLHNTVSKEIRQRLAGHSSSVNSVAYSPEGSILASSSSDATVKLWDVASGKEIRTLIGHGAGIEGLAFSRNGRTILSEAGDVTARLWDASTGQVIRILPQRDGEVAAVGLSPDGRLGVTTRGDYSWHVFDAFSGQDILVLRGQHGNGSAAVFAPDSRSLLTGALDGSIRQWDLHSGLVLRNFRGAAGRVRALALDPSGRFLAASYIKRTFIWDLSLPPPKSSTVKMPAPASEDFQPLWEKLGHPNYLIRTEAVWKFLAGDGPSIEFLKKQLTRSALPLDKSKRLNTLVAQLNDDRYGVRDEAERSIKGLGACVRPALVEALEGEALTPETRDRILRILFASELNQSIQPILAIEILGWHSSPEAKKALKSLSSGPRGELVTEHAKAVLER